VLGVIIKKTIRLAAVQPKAYRFGEEKKNLEKAVKYAEQAAKKGAQLISFPECYPGPYSGPTDFSPVEAMTKAAEDLGVYILFGWANLVKNKIYDTMALASPKGEVIGDYSKIAIAPVDNYLSGGKDFTPGDKVEVYNTDIGKIGISICWEVWFPEFSRILALKGADIILFPTGNVLYGYRRPWKSVLWTRAVENLVYVACSQNLFGNEEGFSHIIGPEEIMLENLKEGSLLADFDLDRLVKLRKNTIIPGKMKETYQTIPGLLQFVEPKKLYKKYLP